MVPQQTGLDVPPKELLEFVLFVLIRLPYVMIACFSMASSDNQISIGVLTLSIAFIEASLINSSSSIWLHLSMFKLHPDSPTSYTGLNHEMALGGRARLRNPTLGL